MLNSLGMGNDERAHESASETKQKVAPKKDVEQPKTPRAGESFDEEESETSKLTGVGAW